MVGIEREVDEKVNERVEECTFSLPSLQPMG